MRGKVRQPIPIKPTKGITPAYAGKSSGAASRSTFQWDHPRLCGEKWHLLLLALMVEGSPPPMRGKVIMTFEMHKNHRITPAYAGKS